MVSFSGWTTTRMGRGQMVRRSAEAWTGPRGPQGNGASGVCVCVCVLRVEGLRLVVGAALGSLRVPFPNAVPTPEAVGIVLRSKVGIPWWNLAVGDDINGSGNYSIESLNCRFCGFVRKKKRMPGLMEDS